MVAITLTGCQQDDDQEEDRNLTTLVKVGDTIPAFTLTGNDGETVTSETLSGKPFLLSFFDTGCPDCREDLPVLQRIYDEYGGELPVLNVPRSQSAEQVAAYWQENGLTMPFYTPADANLYYKFATSIIPRVYVVDGKGTIQAAYNDSPIASYEALSNDLQQLGFTSIPKDSLAIRMNLRVSIPARAMGSTVLDNEYNISRIDVFFFNTQTKELFTRLQFNEPTKYEKTVTPYEATYITGEKRVKVGKYDILAVANYDSIPTSITKMTDLLDLIDCRTYKEGVIASFPTSGPVMTSRATARQNIDLTKYNGKHYTLTLDMERVLAKLQIGVSNEYFRLIHPKTSFQYAEVKITNYKLVNLMTCYYLFQHRDDVITLGTEQPFAYPNTYGEYSQGTNEYIIVPYFYEKKNTPEDIQKCKNYYASWYGDFTTENFASMSVADKYATVYVLPNTMHKDSQVNGYSTGIVFQASVTPTFVYIYDSEAKEVKESYQPELWPTILYFYNYNFYGSIQALNVKCGKSMVVRDYTDEELKAYDMKQCKFNQGVYETFYTYWIPYLNSTTDHMRAMNFGIVRNNHYKMRITGITGIGNSKITPDLSRNNYPNSYIDVAVD